MPITPQQPESSPEPSRPNVSAAVAGASAASPPSAAEEPTRASGSRGFPVADGPYPLESALIEGYELHEEIHRGGQGVVYRATQLGTKQQVAVKVLLEGPFAGETARRRFEREVELAASLRHPGIVTILDSGISHGRYYFAMEYIDGLRLDRHVDHARLPLAQTLELMEKTCLAVNFAHQRGVIHRDLKPSNILVDRHSGPHILDFGLAKPAQQADSDQTTMAMLSLTGQVLGTLAYMSPEQAAGSQDVDVRSDVYALGVILYEALLGQAPYITTGTLAEVVQRIIHEEPIPPRTLRGRSRFGRQIGDELETILLKALDKDPARRYQTAGDLARDLRHYLKNEPIEAKRASGLYMLKKTLRRYRVQATVAGLALLLLIAFAAVFAGLYTREKSARAEAHAQAQAAAAAETKERAARQEAHDNWQRASAAAEQLRQAMVRQKIQNGDLAWARGDLSEARDYYWRAYNEGEDPAARWALRQYYLQTGDSRAQQLYWQDHGPARLSPHGRLAAFCEAPQSIAVRDLETGKTVLWVSTPGPVEVLNLSEEGDLAAAGPNWARLWRADAPRPVAAAELPDGFKALSVHGAGHGQWLLVAGSGVVECYRAADGARVAVLRLAGRVSGAPDGSHTANELAVPTTAGVERVRVDPEGKLRATLIWTPRNRAPQAVRFLEEDRLAVLADGVDVAALPDGDGAPEWTRVLKFSETWNYFDLKLDPPTAALGARDGSAAVYRQGKLDEPWQVCHGDLEDLRLGADGEDVLSLDPRGAATRWTPRGRKEERRALSNRPLAAWAVSADGAVALLAEAGGDVLSYAPGKPNPIAHWTPTRPQLWGAGREELDLSVALNGDGSRGVIRLDQRVRLLDLKTNTINTLRWADPRLPVLREVVLSHDGQLLACLAQTASGDRQAVVFCRADWTPAARTRGPALRQLEPLGPPAELVGGAVRQILFLPDSPQLLLARSNGELLLLTAPVEDKRRPAGLGGAARASLLWTTLESPANLLAVDRHGLRFAAACEDGIVRLFSRREPEKIQRLNIGQTVRALELDLDRNTLLARTAAGAVLLYDLKTLELITQWSQPTRGRRPLAAWIGKEGAILLDTPTGVYEHRYGTVDKLIEQNSGYARQRRIGRALAESDLATAWEEARRLRLENAGLGQSAQESLAEFALRRTVPASNALEWAQTALQDAPASTYLRLGHAAYEGGRFEHAGRWLRQGLELAGGAADAYTLWRIAECRYLAGEFDAAARDLAALPERADLDALDIPKVQLELAAALELAGQNEQAHAVVLQIGKHPRTAKRNDPVATTSARAIGRYIVGIESEGLVASTFEGLLKTVADRSLLFREDLYFFAGELARREGRTAEARAQYLRCRDLARDAWPANWARYRLGQLGPS